MRDYLDNIRSRVSSETRKIIQEQYKNYVVKPFLNEVEMATRRKEIDETTASEIKKYFER